MHELLDAAAAEIEQWQQRSPDTTSVPKHRVANVRDKILALRGCGSVGLLRTGFSHVLDSADLLGIPLSELAPSLLPLAALLDQRQQR
jgi:hypothetical protein